MGVRLLTSKRGCSFLPQVARSWRLPPASLRLRLTRTTMIMGEVEYFARGYYRGRFHQVSRKFWQPLHGKMRTVM